jgi:hypothetical protein
MDMDWTLKLGDLAIVFATLLGPGLAVQTQKCIERRVESKRRRVQIFKTLMATRAAPLSPAHVEALNTIPIEFYGKRGVLNEINVQWKSYLDALSQSNSGSESWNQNRNSSFNKLLLTIANFLGYGFTDLELKREVYFPTAHAQMQTEQDFIRQGLAKLFKGEIALPMDIKTLPADPAVLAGQEELRKLLSKWLDGASSVKVDCGKGL